MPAQPAKKAAAPAHDEKIPPTPPHVLAILIVILIGLMVATFRAAFYPSPPAAWKTIHEKPGLPMTEVNDILSKSGAGIDSIKTLADGTVESWQLKHRTGAWVIQVQFKKSETGVVYSCEQVSCYITNFPSFTRTWAYPPGSSIAPITPPEGKTDAKPPPTPELPSLPAPAPGARPSPPTQLPPGSRPTVIVRPAVKA